MQDFQLGVQQGGDGAGVVDGIQKARALERSLLEFYGQPKPAYEAVRRAFAPLLISLEFVLRPYQAGDGLEITVWLISEPPPSSSQVPCHASQQSS